MSMPQRAHFFALSSVLAMSLGYLGCSSSSSAGADLADQGVDQAPQRPPLGMPISAPTGTWTWIDFPDSVCDDGSPTGIGINPSGTNNLLIFMNGGGACWDYLTCFVLNTSAHGPFGSAEFAALAQKTSGTLLDRTVPTAVSNYNFVFVPYCTGDVHSGDNIASYTGNGQTMQVHHKGRANLKAFLARIAATFPSPDKVVVSGSSAGGFGSALNYDLYRQYFPQGKAYMLDDSGPAFQGNGINSALRSSWYQSWNLNEALGTLCPACVNDLSAIAPIMAGKYPQDRMVLLSYTQDSTISGFFQLSAQMFQTDLYSLAANVLDPQPNFRYFFETGSSHTFLGAPAAAVSQGVGLVGWLDQFINDDPQWMSVKP